MGGSTLHFTGEAQRLHPAAIEMQSDFGVAADRPIDYAELGPCYCTAVWLIGMAGPEHDPVRTRSKPCPLPPRPPGYAGRKPGADRRKLGLQWVANPVAALSRPSGSVCWDYNAPDAIPGVLGGCRFSPTIAEAGLLDPVSYALRVVPGWGRSRKAAMRTGSGHGFPASVAKAVAAPGRC